MFLESLNTLRRTYIEYMFKADFSQHMFTIVHQCILQAPPAAPLPEEFSDAIGAHPNEALPDDIDADAEAAADLSDGEDEFAGGDAEAPAKMDCPKACYASGGDCHKDDID